MICSHYGLRAIVFLFLFLWMTFQVTSLKLCVGCSDYGLYVAYFSLTLYENLFTETEFNINMVLHLKNH